MTKPKSVVTLLLILYFVISLTVSVIAKETRQAQPNPKPSSVNQPRKTQSIWDSIWQLWTSRQKKNLHLLHGV